jgi:hypothetical protein
MTFLTRKALPRRTFLKGAGAAIGLPLLDAMSPALAAPAQDPARNPPGRAVFVYVPNGINMADWTPGEEGAAFALPKILEPLEPYRGQILLLTGLAQDGGRPHGDGPGDHARAAASFLTGAHPVKTPGSGIRNGPSIDQVIARHFENETPFASLELGCEAGGSAGECDSGYSCAYSNNIAWRTATQPLPPESNPRLAFERLFSGFDASGDAAARARSARYDRSILDFVAEDARRIQSGLGPRDRGKLDEYLDSIRDVERRIALAAERSHGLPTVERPAGVPKEFSEHAHLIFDLLTIALQADLTRVATVMMAKEGSNRSYPEIGIPESHHPITHHDNNPEKLAKITAINHYHLEQLAWLLGRLQSTPDGEANLLRNSMLVYGSGISDGNRHDHGNLPVLVAGSGRGKLSAGRHIRYEKEVPMSNLFVSMLAALGLPEGVFGDSTAPLEIFS